MLNEKLEHSQVYFNMSSIKYVNQKVLFKITLITVAVVICFFVCWAPFHGQRLVYIWAMKYMDDPWIRMIFIFTTYASGILYYVSTCINPILYNLMSNKFRQAFKVSISSYTQRKIQNSKNSLSLLI